MVLDRDLGNFKIFESAHEILSVKVAQMYNAYRLPHLVVSYNKMSFL